MQAEFVDTLSGALEALGCRLDPGLDPGGLREIEQRFGFCFPPDLAEFLRWRVPTGKGFPNWRSPDDPALRSSFAWPEEGLIFDVEHDVWPDAWGARPGSPHEAIETVRALVRQAPVLVPVFGHRYLPSEPCAAGNPVLSVYQTDIIVYGDDLEDYLAAEFALPVRRKLSDGYLRAKQLRFWGELID